MTRVCPLVFLVALTIGTPSAASDSEPFNLIQRAATISNIRTAEVAPFRLTAKITVNSAQPLEADYVLTWAAPDAWREEISIGNEHAIRIGGKNTVSVKNDSEQAQSIRSILRSFDAAAMLHVKSNESLGRVKKRLHGGVEVQCLSRAARMSAKSELCFDAVTGVLVSDQSGDNTSEFSKYADFRGKQFPRLVTTFSGKAVYDVMHVIDLEGIAPDASLFRPDPQYTTTPGCEHPVVPTPIKLPDPEYPEPLRTASPQRVKLSATVTESGGVEGISVVRSAGALDGYAIKALERWRFSPATCDGHPVPFRFFTEVNFRTY